MDRNLGKPGPVGKHKDWRFPEGVKTAIVSAVMKVRTQRILSAKEVQQASIRHRRRLLPVVGPHLERSSRGVRHPVMDFLFEYYSFAPGKLLAWHPGLEVELEGENLGSVFEEAPYRRSGNRVSLDPGLFPARRAEGLDWVIRLLEAVRDRDPRYACFGLHEWAMVYRTDQPRHGQLPLRMDPDRLAAFVESRSIVCSHIDAFRFFTPPARPLNRLQPRRDNQVELEQGGCLHANMDLYKWSYKYHPWVSAELLADTFLLAVKIRETDMMASPYDVRALGYEPIPIETPEGREEYIRRQKCFADKAVPLRERLLNELQHLRRLITSIGR